MALTKPQGDMMMKLAAEQASTSGTAITFSSIPAGTSMIIVMFDGVSTNGTVAPLIQLGTSGGLQATSYAQAAFGATAAPAAFENNATTGFGPTALVAGTDVLYGQLILTLQDATNNVWTACGNFYADAGTDYAWGIAGKIALSAVLDRVAAVSGTNSFDAGAISIAYF